MVLGFVGLPPSTYYAFKARQAAQTHNEPPDGSSLDTQGSSRCGGRPMSSCCRTHDGKIVSNEQVKEWLNELVCGDGFPYGYRKLTVCLREDYGLIINHKKVYRLCKELGVLLPQRKVSLKRPRRPARKDTVTGPNQLWEMDMKYGYIHGIRRFFFQLSLIDVFDRTVIDYHLGLSCTATDACRVLKNSLKRRGLHKGMQLPKLRTDNGPQFVAK